MTTPVLDRDVLVVGAGPAGLATAVAAAGGGARVLVVERRSTTSTIPRATGVSARSMEIVRSWGLTDAVLAGAVDCEPRIAVARTLLDPEQESVDPGFPSRSEALRASPAFPVLCPQDHIEPVLVDEIRRRGGQVRFDAGVVDLDVGPAGVTARLADGAVVRARHVVGADGPRSTVRAAAGIGLDELGVLGEWVQVLFRAELTERLDGPPHVLWSITHPDAAGVLLPVGGGRWCYARQWWPDRGEQPADHTPARWTALIRTATGIPDLEPELLGTQTFTMAASVAYRMRRGPAFLVGDAAHRMTPVGGAGLNTALHDGHELGWRLAWVARGWAGDELLDAFADEREPVGRARALRSLRAGEPDALDGLAGDMGVTYRSSVIADDGAAPAEGHHRTARPGERAPHAWVREDGVRRSVLDLLGPGFTLVAGPGCGVWRAEAAFCPVPVTVLSGLGGSVERRYRLRPGSAVLLRPDGVVAWRHDGPVRCAGGELADAVRRAAGLTARSVAA